MSKKKAVKAPVVKAVVKAPVKAPAKVPAVKVPVVKSLVAQVTGQIKAKKSVLVITDSDETATKAYFELSAGLKYKKIEGNDFKLQLLVNGVLVVARPKHRVTPEYATQFDTTIRIYE